MKQLIDKIIPQNTYKGNTVLKYIREFEDLSTAPVITLKYNKLKVNEIRIGDVFMYPKLLHPILVLGFTDDKVKAVCLTTDVVCSSNLTNLNSRYTDENYVTCSFTLIKKEDLIHYMFSVNILEVRRIRKLLKQYINKLL